MLAATVCVSALAGCGGGSSEPAASGDAQTKTEASEGGSETENVDEGKVINIYS